MQPTAGWRQWPMLSTTTFGSMFATVPGHNGGEKPCKTGPPSASDIGTTSDWDDVIRHGSGNSCIRTDSFLSDDFNRLTTYNLHEDDDNIGSGDCCIRTDSYLTMLLTPIWQNGLQQVLLAASTALLRCTSSVITRTATTCFPKTTTQTATALTA